MLVTRHAARSIGIQARCASTTDLRQKINHANHEAISHYKRSEIVLEDVVPAQEMIPFLKPGSKRFLHAGPPVNFANMCNAMKGAAAGMIMLEGWAKDVNEALHLMETGEIEWAANNDHFSVGPMSGIITPTFPVWVVRNRVYDAVSFSRPADLHQQFGNYHHLDAVRHWRDFVGPTFRKALKGSGPIDLYPLLQASLESGDELHNRVNAFTLLLGGQLSLGLIKSHTPNDEIQHAMEFVYNDPNGVRLTLGLAMACGQALLHPVCGVEYSTIISCMARNGTDWGIRVSPLHPQWFTAPAPTCHKYFTFQNYTKKDFGLDMGDSVITETAGWGAFLAGNSLALAHNVGATPDEAFATQASNREYCIDRNDRILIPSFAYEPGPLGIDLRRVIAKGKTFLINTGIAHKEMGHSVVARGLLYPPMECFTAAAEAWC